MTRSPLLTGLLTFTACSALALLLAVLWAAHPTPARLRAACGLMFAGSAGITVTILVWAGRNR